MINRLTIHKLKRDLSKVNKIDLAKVSDANLKETYSTTDDYIMAMAILKEVFLRVKGIALYNEQLLAVLALYNGYICEIATGEGKTYINIASAALLFKFTEEPVFIVTVNSYLANRDHTNAEDIYDYIGIKSTCLKENEEYSIGFHEGYSVIFTATGDLAFSYLRNSTHYDLYNDFPFNNVIVDEIDYILIDNATSGFSVSDGRYSLLNFQDNLRVYYIAKDLYSSLEISIINNKTSYAIDSNSLCTDAVYNKHTKQSNLTEQGIQKVLKILDGKVDIFTEVQYALLRTIDANLTYKLGVDYIVKDNKIVLIDKSSGRLLPHTQLENGLQTAIELKENLPTTHQNHSGNSISCQFFYMNFKNLVGLSGTVAECKKEFEDVFNKQCITIPRHVTDKRIDYPDVYVKTDIEKRQKLLDLISDSSPRPIVIVTSSEMDANNTSNFLNKHNIWHNLLISITTTNEEKIIQQAGHRGSILVTTQITGRGTDIVLDNSAKDMGLVVILLNKFNNSRIERQIKGRAGRQGDHGCTYCIVSIEDNFFSNLEDYNMDCISEYKTYTSQFNYYITECITQAQASLLSNGREIRRKMNIYDSVIHTFKITVLTHYMELTVTNDLNDASITTKFDEYGEELSNKLIKQIYLQLYQDTWFSFETSYLKQMFEVYFRQGERNIHKYILDMQTTLNDYIDELKKTSLDYFISSNIT